MDSDESKSGDEVVEMIFETKIVESSEDPPRDEWSSLEFSIPEENRKKILYDEGLYSPGSGEICTKYITLSDSAVLRHPYYCYPAITDPGIEKALLEPEGYFAYADDGQDLYLATCQEMNQCPVRSFHRALLESCIDLRYYCVNPFGIRAMATALRYNKTVKNFNLTDNFLNDDSCYHLGEMLLTNNTLTELNLYGCRIGAEGLNRLLSGLPHNRGLQNLNLSHNQLGDAAMEHLAEAIFFGIDLKKINLSYNNISGKGASFLTEAFETHNKFTHIDLSWNNLFTPGTYGFLMRLAESTNLQVLNLSWNSLCGPRIGLALKEILLCPLLKKIILSNNKLEGEAIRSIIGSLGKAKKLVKLNLSYNPLTPSDALTVLNKVKLNAVKVRKVFMDNVFVNGEFLALLERIKQMKAKKNVIITYGGVIGGFIAKGPDPREVILNRVEYVAKKPKRNKVDIALIALQLQKDNFKIMNVKDFGTALTMAGASLGDDLVEELTNTFAGPRHAKFRTIDINLLVDYIKRKWPDRKLPPTPPPEPEPEPVPVVPKGKGKLKGKK